MTQLTASWAKDKIEEKYDTDALVYTLGLNVGGKEPALSLLDPSNNDSTDAYWATFIGLANASDKTMSVNIKIGGTENKTITYTNPVNSAKGWSEDYVTEYFGAINSTQLTNAFSDIVEQIIIQSLYYPTLVDGSTGINHDGFLQFEDYIGSNMEVKAVKGIQLGSNLYDGSTLARMMMTGGLGTEANPTDVGNEFIWAVQSRLYIDDVLVARRLVEDAYAHGQLYYDAVTGEYSNYIGWYANGEGKFVGFWDGEDASPEAVPAELKDTAVFANKSYGYYDAVGEGHRKTDMMYATILVSTTLKDSAPGKIGPTKTGEIRVIGKIPASLIPLVEYDIQLNGTDPQNPQSMTIKGATAPSRLLYEVGLSSKIDILNLEETAPDALVKNADGDYIFYTNQWQDIEADGYAYTYATDKNAVSFFEPSKENERYYYNINSDIFTNTNGTLYKSATAPQYNKNSPLYHRTLIYKEVGGRVVAEWYYEEISEHVLTHTGDVAKNADNTWYVRAGVIHHYFGDYEMEKDENPTDTINYSDKPFVHDPVVGINHNDYHVDSYLGNNGLLTLDAYEGIKVTKFADTSITNRERAYEFTVAAAGVNAELTLVIEDAQGDRQWSTINFNESYTVSLKHNEAAYILGDALIGKTVTVTENIPNGADYEVKSVNGDTSLESATIAVADAQIGNAHFINGMVYDGDVIVAKTVVSELDSHYVEDFSFNAVITGLESGKTYYAVKSTSQTPIELVNGNNAFTLKHSESIVFKKLPEGATVTVTETAKSGFTTPQSTQSATVVAGTE